MARTEQLHAWLLAVVKIKIHKVNCESFTMSRVDNCPVTANDTRSDAKSVLHNGDEKWRETEEERHSLFSVSGFRRLKMV